MRGLTLGLGGAIMEMAGGLIFLDNPLPATGRYLCCQYCNDFNNDGVWD